MAKAKPKHLPKRRAPSCSRARAITGMTQARFSEVFRVPITTLSNWEQGLRTPDTCGRLLMYLIEHLSGRVEACLSTAPADMSKWAVMPGPVADLENPGDAVAEPLKQRAQRVRVRVRGT